MSRYRLDIIGMPTLYLNDQQWDDLLGAIELYNAGGYRDGWAKSGLVAINEVGIQQETVTTVLSVGRENAWPDDILLDNFHWSEVSDKDYDLFRAELVRRLAKRGG